MMITMANALIYRGQWQSDSNMLHRQTDNPAVLYDVSLPTSNLLITERRATTESPFPAGPPSAAPVVGHHIERRQSGTIHTRHVLH